MIAARAFRAVALAGRHPGVALSDHALGRNIGFLQGLSSTTARFATAAGLLGVAVKARRPAFSVTLRSGSPAATS
jgi:hypothetical protein